MCNGGLEQSFSRDYRFQKITIYWDKKTFRSRNNIAIEESNRDAALLVDSYPGMLLSPLGDLSHLSILYGYVS
ncbi:hypothetical protein BH18THE2_BH18THE2_28880 [soil metagenome]